VKMAGFFNVLSTPFSFIHTKQVTGCFVERDSYLDISG